MRHCDFLSCSEKRFGRSQIEKWPPSKTELLLLTDELSIPMHKLKPSTYALQPNSATRCTIWPRWGSTTGILLRFFRVHLCASSARADSLIPSVI